MQVFETDGWLVSHRRNSALPGYLMVGSKASAKQLFDLPVSTLSELGPLLSDVQKVLVETLNAHRVYIGRYGHSPGYPIHFHVIPIFDWVEDLFWQDRRYRVLETLADGPGETPTDGAELTLFVWREFCEHATPPAIQGPSVGQAIASLKEAMTNLREH